MTGTEVFEIAQGLGIHVLVEAVLQAEVDTRMQHNQRPRHAGALRARGFREVAVGCQGHAAVSADDGRGSSRTAPMAATLAMIIGAFLRFLLWVPPPPSRCCGMRGRPPSGGENQEPPLQKEVATKQGG